MNPKRPAIFWLAVTLIAAALIYVLKPVLLPFVAGALVAYLLQPPAVRLEKMGLPRWCAVVLTLLMFLLFVAAAIMLVVPLLSTQAASLIEQLPHAVDVVRTRLTGWTPFLARKLGSSVSQLKSDVGAMTGDAAKLVLPFLGRILAGGAVLIDALSLMFVMPVVAFYLLRDWPQLVATVDGWLPRPIAPTVRELFAEMDRIIAAFIRGVSMVCLLLAIFYAAALTLIGLHFGLAVGLFAGLAAFVPVFGALVAFALTMLLALSQFSDWSSIILVMAVFGVGQILEGYVLTPRFVGHRVGLHPVWILFALMAGAALFGFVGVLLAVPTAAAIGVLTRFALSRYRESAYFQGHAGP